MHGMKSQKELADEEFEEKVKLVKEAVMPTEAPGGVVRMNTEMTPKEPVVKLLQEIKGNLDDMGTAGLKGELRSDAASYVCARLSGKIEQYLESIDKEDTK